MGDIKSLVKGVVGSVGLTIAIGILSAIPISMIVMGALYKDDCKAEEMIPIYLIVMGVVTVVRNIITICFRLRSDNDDDMKVNPCTCVLDLFLFAWFIAGCVYIYRTKEDFQSHDTTLDDYCDYTLYWYSFWVTTGSFILLGFIMVLACFVACCSLCCS